MSTVPIVSAKPPGLALPAEQFGLLGVTLDVVPNSSNGQHARAIPTITVIWMDERQTCLRVLQFIHHGQAPDLAGCPQYHNGNCARGNGRQVSGAAGNTPAPCLFHESREHPTWARAATWQYDPVSGSVIPASLWAQFGLQEAGSSSLDTSTGG